MTPVISEDQLRLMLAALRNPKRDPVLCIKNFYVQDHRHEGWEDLVQKGLAYGGPQPSGRPFVYSVSALGLALLGVTEMDTARSCETYLDGYQSLRQLLADALGVSNPDLFSDEELIERVTRLQHFVEKLSQEDWRGHEPNHVREAKEVLR